MFQVPLSFLINHFPVEESERRAVFDEFSANGAKNIVLSGPWIKEILRDFSLAKKLRQELSDSGLKFADAHSPYGGFLDMNCPDPEFRPQMILRHKMAMRIAASLGIKTITIHPGTDRFFPEIPLEQHYDFMRNALDQLLPEAEDCGLIIAIENSFTRSTRPDAIIALKKEYPTNLLGFCYDSGHANLLDAGRHQPVSRTRQYWKLVGVDEPYWDDRILEKMLPEIVNCHLHDNDGSDDFHSLPGDGTVDWKKVLSLLSGAPRLQVIQSEVHYHPRYKIPDLCRKFQELNKL